MTAVYGVVVGLAVLVFLLGLLVVGLLRSHADILRRLESIGVGLDSDHGHDSHASQITMTRKEPTPVREHRISGVTPNGEPLVVSLGAGADPALVAFLSTTCSTCTPFWEGIQASFMHFGGYRHRVVIVTLGESEESPSRAKSLAKPEVEVIMSSSGWSEFEVPGAPYFVLLEPGTGRVIGEGSAMTFESLEEFLIDATNDQKWDIETAQRTLSEEDRIDADLRRAGILPDDPRLYPEKGEISEDGRT